MMPRLLPLLFFLLPLLSAHVPASQHPASRPGGKDYALFFAVETYDNNSAWKNLPGLIKECEDIRNDLVDRYGFSSDSKVVRNPTLNDIAAELAHWRSRSYGPDDQLLVFFSGHGQFLDDVQEGFFIPSNGKSKDADLISRNWYSLLTLPRHVTTIKCPHILLAIDACYSGTIDSQVALKNENEEWDEPASNGEAQFNQYVHDLLANKSRLLMTSGGKNRTKHPSDFVRWFREALATLGGQDRLLRPADIEERWPASTVGRPLSGTFEGHEPGGNFLFVYQPKTLPPSVVPDYDEDGIPDTTDKCPAEAGPAATKGCPDQDGDGVADKFDRCQTEKGPATNEGCPVAPGKPEPVTQPVVEKNDFGDASKNNSNQKSKADKPLSVTKVTVTANEISKNIPNKRRVTKSASKTDEFQICFLAVPTEGISTGMQEFHIQIINPTGSTIITNSASDINSSAYNYTLKTSMYYDGANIRLCELYKSSNFFKGTYIVNIWNKGLKVGSGSVTLGK